jgi:hypothetical protein
MPLVSRHLDQTFNEPVLVMCLEGWIDAGLGAGAAMAALLGSRETEQVASWDADELIDHRARRPVLRLSDGVAQGVRWPEIELRATVDDAGRDLLLLVGPEPDMRWHAFAASVTAEARALGVRLVVGLGAFPAPVPHTRPVRLVATAPTAELAAEVGFIPGGIEVPAGIQAVLEVEFNNAGIPAVGLWARVPHYLVSMPYPAASAALVDGLASLAGVTLSSAELQTAALSARDKIDELIANSAEHQAMVAQLEAQVDREVEMIGPLPSGDELAAELERYLRGEGAT